jgi:hypothetical protein
MIFQKESVDMVELKNNAILEKDEILKTNKSYWNANADLWFGTTALPTGRSI